METARRPWQRKPVLSSSLDARGESPVTTLRNLRTWRLLVAASVLAAILPACRGESPGGGSSAPPPATASVAAPATSESAPVQTTAATTTATTAGIEPTAAAAFDPTGAYFPMTDLPPEFQELEHLGLATIDDNAAPAPLNGFLRPKAPSAADYLLVKPSLNGKTLTFTTTTVRGVHYTFTGAFPRLGNFPETPPSYEEVALSGTLTKLRDGQTIASTPVHFRYEAGG
jgi:hypothetical protein